MTEQGGEPSREEARKYAQVVAEAWLDPEFKQRLKQNPAEVLREAGIDVPAGVEVRVVDSSQEVRTFEIPARPTFTFTLPVKPRSLDQQTADEALLEGGRSPMIACGCGFCRNSCIIDCLSNCACGSTGVCGPCSCIPV